MRNRVRWLVCVAPIAAAGCVNVNAPSQPHKSVLAAAAQASQAVAATEPIVFDDKGGSVDATGAAPDMLTLPEAVRRAISTHPDIQAALSRVRVAQADVDQATLFPNPVLSVSIRGAFEGKTAIEAGLGEDLVAFLTRPGRISVADSRLRAASADAVSTTLDVLADVQQRYAAAQALDEIMPVLEERRRLLGRLLSLAQSRLRRGEGTRLDVTTLDAQRVELDVEIKEQQLARRQERLGLTRLIGEPSGSAEWKLSPWQPPPQLTAGESTWVDVAIAGRPEIQARQFELAALGREVRLSPLGIFEGNGVGVDTQKDPDWQVGPALTMPLPVFDWGQARREKAVALVIEARHQLTQAKREIIEEVRKAYETFAASQEALGTVRTELIPLQEQRREQAEAAYKAGQTDITGLVLAEQDLQASRARLIELQRRTSAALIGLERAVGGPRVLDRLAPSGPATAPAGASNTSPAAEAVPMRAALAHPSN